jgi:hypothetical protein
MLQSTTCPELSRAHCQSILEKAGFGYKQATGWTEAAETPEQLYALERAAQLVLAMKQEGVLPHVAVSYVARALDMGASTGEARTYSTGARWHSIYADRSSAAARASKMRPD